MYQTLQGTVGWFAGAVGIPQERKYNSVLFGGLIGSLFSLLQFICSPLTGAASDYLGRRRVIIINSFGIIEVLCYMGHVKKFWSLPYLSHGWRIK
ncbi:unnamed protein product [Staurois parvus]|uniref:Major facilitator superfamily (MFS) profile domain-containing protein n=1 Tax=Staurois parvus TaxID=386267 RepID=A0ABN9GWY5_9NEOB|nr:unnamed protein product [Staurois parvus]